MKTGLKLPNQEALQRYAVNVDGQLEGFWNPLYDYQTYATAGTTVQTFFQNPVGQGLKTLEDTNMKLGGQLPKPTAMLVTGVEVVFFPGVDISTFGAAQVSDYVNDVQAIMQSGYLDFRIGDKSYLQDGPLQVFPCSFRFGGFAGASNATAAAAAQSLDTSYLVATGQTYEIVPVKLMATQSFSVSLNWSAAVPTPSGQDGRIGVRLLGYSYRLAQ